MALDTRLLQELLALRRRLQEAIERVEVAPPRGGAWPAGAGWEPAVDVWEGPDEVVVEIEVPGARGEDLALRLEDGDLVVTGLLPAESVEEGRYLRMERTRGPFSRRVPLPVAVDGSPRAFLRNGVLRVHLPKAAALRRRQVPVRVEGV